LSSAGYMSSAAYLANPAAGWNKTLSWRIQESKAELIIRGYVLIGEDVVQLENLPCLEQCKYIRPHALAVVSVCYRKVLGVDAGQYDLSIPPGNIFELESLVSHPCLEVEFTSVMSPSISRKDSNLLPRYISRSMTPSMSISGCRC